MHRVLAELELDGRRAPLERRADASRHRDGEPRADAREVEAGLPFARELARGRRVLAVGRIAEAALGRAVRPASVAWRRDRVS